MGILSLILILIVLVGIGIILAITYGIFKITSRKGFDKRLRLLALIPFLIVGYFIYTAFYPTEEFYKEDFEQVTGAKFPENAVIEYKWASYPDHFGDYSSVSLVKADEAFYTRLLQVLPQQGFTKPGEKDIGLMEYNRIKNQIEDRKIEQQFSVSKRGGLVYYVGFLSDKETMIVQRTSW
jgi:hypothetical protein